MGIKGLTNLGAQGDPGDEQDEETPEPKLPSPDEVIETFKEKDSLNTPDPYQGE